MTWKWKKRASTLVISSVLLTSLPFGGVAASPTIRGSELSNDIALEQRTQHSSSNAVKMTHPAYKSSGITSSLLRQSALNQPVSQQVTDIWPTSTVQQDSNTHSTVSTNVYTGSQSLLDGMLGKETNVQSNKKVIREVKEKRTSNSKHYLLEDGSYQAVIGREDVHYEDENGQLQDIQIDLTDEAEIDKSITSFSKESSGKVKSLIQDGMKRSLAKKVDKDETAYRPLHVPFQAELPKKYNKGYSIGKGNDKLTFIPVGASSVVGTVYGKGTILYSKAWNSTDVELKITETGVKETLVLKDSSAPTLFSFEVKGKLDDKFKSGNLQLEPAWLEDSSGIHRDVVQKIRVEENKTFIDLFADVSNLVYPVKVDPTVTMQPSVKGMNTSITSRNRTPPTPGSPRSTISINKDYFTEGRGLLQFDLSSFKSDITIKSANVSLYRFTGGDGWQIAFYKNISSWAVDTAYWDNQPQHDPNVSDRTWVGGNGWYNWDITNLVQQWVSGTSPNYGVKIIGENAINGLTSFYASDYHYNEPTLIPKITIVYNEPSSIPLILSPSSNDVWDGTSTISWTAANDSETPQSQLKYHIQLSTNGGSTWSDIVALTNAGVTTFSYDFSSIAESTNALVRVRGYDGGLYSAWGQSAQFRIAHNHAPNVPSNINPLGTSIAPALATITPILNWTFSDPDAGNTQSAYEVIISNSSGTNIYDSGWVNSSANTFTVPNGKLSRNNLYNWQVRVKDNKGADSSYTASSYIKINSQPTLSLTSYVDGQQIPDNVLNFTWTYADVDGQVQTSYQILGSQDNWATVGYNTGIISGNATTKSTTALASGIWSFKVLVNDGVEWSNPVIRSNLTLSNAYEPNDTSAQAFAINYSQNYNSLISSVTDIDFYKYVASATGLDRFILNVPAGLNYDAYIYDSNMNLIALTGRGAGLAENILYDVTAGSTYYIKIVGVGGNYSTTLPYSFIVNKLSMQFQSNYQFDSNGNIINKTTTKSN
ncbi:DNRLRE domain-containing protein [Paenibacillus sp. SYP-B3998]|uniref:DNRLRE domain-containing protein n=1 Tax=Paenibacillus sp. SYP-B3998 TaxID=2678564 RepID=A0A6G4A342_9BACL|nr:DNRLRE domain-containing protein [Paenibacillus sp. SYP-B3998]NEW08354.1 DNRLRE domain-containing protein [Paenibacillus sp. SYP-B3998]